MSGSGEQIATYRNSGAESDAPMRESLDCNGYVWIGEHGQSRIARRRRSAPATYRQRQPHHAPARPIPHLLA